MAVAGGLRAVAAFVGRRAYRYRDRVRRRRRLLPGAAPRADAVQPGLCLAGVPAAGPRAGPGRDPGLPPGLGRCRSRRHRLRRRARRARQLPGLVEDHRTRADRPGPAGPRPARPGDLAVGLQPARRQWQLRSGSCWTPRTTCRGASACWRATIRLAAGGSCIPRPAPPARRPSHDLLGALGRAGNRLDAEQLAGPPAPRAVTPWMMTGQLQDLVAPRPDRPSPPPAARATGLG